MNTTRVIWINRHGKRMAHGLNQCTFFYAQNWWRENILNCQGILSVDERRNSKLRLLAIENHLPPEPHEVEAINRRKAIMAIELKAKRDWQGWAGWCGGQIYSANVPQSPELDKALQAKAKETGTGAAVIVEDNCLYGWGYTDERYKDGPYFWPFFIESDTFRDAKKTYTETRSQVKDE